MKNLKYVITFKILFNLIENNLIKINYLFIVRFDIEIVMLFIFYCISALLESVHISWLLYAINIYKYISE